MVKSGGKHTPNPAVLPKLYRNPGEGGNKMLHYRVMSVAGCVTDMQNMRS